MLTVDQIKNISFKKASIGGYKCDEVDTFIDDVTATVEDLKKKNAEIIAKSELLMTKVEEMRSNEDSVSAVLVKSQKEADKTVKEAKKTAAQILKDARAEADKIIADANNRIIREKDMIVQITEEAAVIRKKLIEEFEQQIESLKVLPDVDESEKLEKSLNEKYPTEIYSNSEKPSKKAEQESEEVEEVFDTIEEAARDAASATEDSANAEAAAAEPELDEADEEPEEEDGEEEKEEPKADAKEAKDGKIQIDKSKFENRFGKLKFGDDYDVKKDQ